MLFLLLSVLWILAVTSKIFQCMEVISYCCLVSVTKTAMKTLIRLFKILEISDEIISIYLKARCLSISSRFINVRYVYVLVHRYLNVLTCFQIMRLFSACVLICAVAGQCPSPDNTGLNLEPDSSSAVVRSYPSIKWVHDLLCSSSDDRLSSIIVPAIRRPRLA